MNPALVSSPLVFTTVLMEAIRNVFFFGIGCAVIIFVGRISWWFGFFLFVLFTLLVVWSVLHQLFTFGIGVVYIFSLVFGKGAERLKGLFDWVVLSAAHVVQLAELLIMVIYNVVIYQSLFT